MFQAAKFGDLVLGIDLHMVLVPGVPSPVPLPHPFLGVVFDPLGAALGAALGAVFGGGGPVLLNGAFPVGNTGTDVRGLAHFPMPPGASFAPNDLPDCAGTILTGSETVSMGGSSAGRLTSLVMTCNFPVNLPTSVCLAVPFGAPVLVGGPDSVDGMAAVTRGIRTRWFSDNLHGLLKARPGSRLSKVICFLTGHPVDVMTGEVLADAIDFELPGLIPLVFERNYASRGVADGPLGPGWHHPLDASVVEAPRGLAVRLPDGREREHDALAPGASLWDDLDRYTLERVGNGYRLTTWGGQSYHFEPAAGAKGTHALARITDRCGNAITCRYDGGRLAEVTDSAGRVLRFASRGGRLAAIRQRNRADDAWLDLVRYEYEDGRLVAAVDPKGHATRYAYRGGVLVRETNRNGLSFHFEYDADHPDGWCVRTWGDGGIYDRRITYDKHHHVTIVDDSRGGRTHYFGNAAGLVDREIDPTGRERRYEWDPSCRKLAEVDGLGNRTEWAYDAWGNTTLERDALGGETRWRFNDLHLPIEITDPAGRVWRRAYDPRGKLRCATDPLGNETRFEHDTRGRLTAAEDPLGRRATRRFDERGDLAEGTDREGATSRYAFDDSGRPVRQIDPRGGETRLSWDACGRLERMRRPDGEEIRFARDPEGNVVERTDGLGNTTRYRYGGLNKLVERIDPAGGVVRYAHDTEEDLVGVTNELGETYRFEVDLAGRVVKEKGFDGRTLERSYDRAGRCREGVNGAGQRTKIERDAKGRIVKLRMPGPVPPGKVLPGVEEIEYAHDALDQLVRAKNSAAEILFERDALGRVIAERSGAVVIESRYDAAGARIGRRTSLGQETSYDVDANGALRGIAFGFDPRFHDFSPEALAMGGPPVRAPWKATLARDALGAETERRLPGGVVSRWERDRAGRPAMHAVGRDSAGRDEAPIEGVSYLWRPGDQLAALIDAHEGPTRFAHDARSYLVSATRPDGTVQHRAPDEVGNVFRNPTGSDRSHGPGGRLMEADGVRHLHDADGQLIEKALPDGARWKYRWDAQGQLIEVARPDGRKVTFAYDALGRRVRKAFDGRTTTYLWDGNDLVHEVSEGAPLVTWEFEPGTFTPLAKVEGERRYGVVNDHLGTPTALFDEAGDVAWKGQLDLYGVARTEGMKTRCPWRWPGQYEDEETGLYYNRFRYYDPATGRYISQDPIGLVGGLELYNYAPNPIHDIDPFGLMKCVGGDNFRGHYLAHRNLLGNMLHKKFPKWKVDQGAEFLKDLGDLVASGRFVSVGQGTLKKNQPVLDIYRGEGLTLALRSLGNETSEFVTLISSGKGLDLGIQFL